MEELLKVYSFDKKIRLGEKKDGGYVIGDLIDNNVKYDCYISAGVSNEESFTRDFLNKYNYLNIFDCYAFDGTINNYPYNYTQNIMFIKKNIGNIDNDKVTNLYGIIEKYNDIFLKMDIEGGEYPWFKSLNLEQLNKFSQIVLEFHWIHTTNTNDFKEALEKLINTHYIIHAHGNNYRYNEIKNIPNVLELTLINRKYFQSTPELNKIPFPIIGLDFPNNPHSKDFKLDYYPFVSN